MGSEKKIIEWESLSKWEMGVMVIMLPIFAVVARVEHVLIYVELICAIVK